MPHKHKRTHKHKHGYFGLDWEQLTAGLRARLEREAPRRLEQLRVDWIKRGKPERDAQGFKPLTRIGETWSREEAT